MQDTGFSEITECPECPPCDLNSPLDGAPGVTVGGALVLAFAVALVLAIPLIPSNSRLAMANREIGVLTKIYRARAERGD